MTPKPAPRIYDAAALPDYPFGADDRLPAHHFTMIYHHQWLNSTLHLSADMAVQGAALNLFFIAQSQSPIGTLPDDDLLLSRLLRIDLTAWMVLRDRSMGALHNWRPCRCGDQVRLMHDTVLRGLQDAFAKREQREQSNTKKAMDMRLDRLRKALDALGCDRSVVADDTLNTRMDEWLTATRPGNRSLPSYEAALLHAANMGWIGGKPRRG